ncbi:A/G-specific adenine glycosylase [Patescibacteria group bacterium]|nr:A/G-specific adenine glycosylase [Patescibacteria group bacterium]
MMEGRRFSMTEAEAHFASVVWKYYAEKGRHDLPWRKSHHPYHVLVSEMMLQQTQVERVIPKYQTFLKTFPTVKALAEAPLADVLTLWQGLGYNRRAGYLHKAAQAIVSDHKGRFPKDRAALLSLPGVGSYTASALMAFAYNAPVVLIETNVRTVFIYHFFNNRSGIKDASILKLVERTLPSQRSRDWYAALMDYGTYLKRTVGNLNAKSSSYKKQTRFVGSARQVRGAIMRTLVKDKRALSLLDFEKRLTDLDITKIRAQLQSLVKESLVVCTRDRYHLPH